MSCSMAACLDIAGCAGARGSKTIDGIDIRIPVYGIIIRLTPTKAQLEHPAS